MTALLHAAATDTGRVRSHNEDQILAAPEHGLFAVIDGVGGHSGGEVAAAIARDALLREFPTLNGDIPSRIREAITAANQAIFDAAQQDPSLLGMACVLTVAVIDGPEVTVGHVGDSRLYILSRGHVEKVTRDHSPVGVREDSGDLTEREAMQHPRRNVVFRDVGTQVHQPDDSEFVDIYTLRFDADCALLLCTDGLTDLITAEEIRHVVVEHAGRPEPAVAELIGRANAAGGRDNVSVVLIEGPEFSRFSAHDTGPIAVGNLESTRPILREVVNLSDHYGESRRRARHHESRISSTGIAVLLTSAAVLVAALVIAGPTLRERFQNAPPVLSVGPDGYTTIGSALAAAGTGQTIEIASGTYRETLTLKSGVHLRSQEPRGAVLSWSTGEAGIVARNAQDSVIDGLVLAGTGAQSPYGIVLENSSVQVRNVEVSGTEEVAISVRGADFSRIERCFLHENLGIGVEFAEGVGTELLANLILVENEVSPVERGGIVLRGNARPSLIDNRVTSSVAEPVWTESDQAVTEYLEWNEFTPPADRDVYRFIDPEETNPTQINPAGTSSTGTSSTETSSTETSPTQTRPSETSPTEAGASTP